MVKVDAYGLSQISDDLILHCDFYHIIEKLNLLVANLDFTHKHTFSIQQ